MASDFIQRQIQRFLSEAEEALTRFDWADVQLRAEAMLRLDPTNADAQALLAAAQQEPIPSVTPLPLSQSLPQHEGKRPPSPPPSSPGATR